MFGLIERHVSRLTSRDTLKCGVETKSLLSFQNMSTPPHMHVDGFSKQVLGLSKSGYTKSIA